MKGGPEDRLNKQLAKLQSIIASSQDVDDRLSYGQIHAVAVEALGAEPIAFVCNLLALATDAKSKMTMEPAETMRFALAVHDRIYGSTVDVKARKKANSDNQFELEFAWATPAGDEVKATAEGSV